jgi:hypothetical protein
MRESTQDYSARRIQFDCELPENARSELLRPKHPAILGWHVYQPACAGIFKGVGGFALCAILLSGVIGHYSQGLKAPATPQPDPVLQHSRQIRPNWTARSFGLTRSPGNGWNKVNSLTGICMPGQSGEPARFFVAITGLREEKPKDCQLQILLYSISAAMQNRT